MRRLALALTTLALAGPLAGAASADALCVRYESGGGSWFHIDGTVPVNVERPGTVSVTPTDCLP